MGVEKWMEIMSIKEVQRLMEYSILNFHLIFGWETTSLNEKKTVETYWKRIMIIKFEDKGGEKIKCTGGDIC